MRRFLWIIGSVLALLIAGATLVAWSWTRTPHGPMDLGPALLLHLAPVNPPTEFTPEARRLANARLASFMPEAVPGVAIRDADFPGPGGPVPLRIYSPESPGPEPLPIVVYLHGGGWWMGDDLAGWDGACSQMAVGIPAVVVSVDYRLAPEHPFPAGVDDSYAALVWTHAHARELGGDPNKLALHGSSAGGNLVGAVTLRARERGGPAARAQVLLVPAMNLAPPESESMRLFGEGYTLSSIHTMVAAYVGEDGDPKDPLISPLRAEDLSGLPPALILTAQFDPLRDDAERYGARLREAGVAAEIKRFDGAVHGFLLSPGARAESTELTIAALRRAFADPNWAPPRKSLPVRLR